MKTRWRLADGTVVEVDENRVDLPWKAHPGMRYLDHNTGQKWELFHKNATGRALVWVPVSDWTNYAYRSTLPPRDQARHPAPKPLAPRPRRTLPA